MSSSIANTAAKIPPASSGPRQLSTMPPCDLLSDMVEQLPLILAVGGDRVSRRNMKPIPHAIELPQTAAQLFRYFEALLQRRLRTPPPPARKLIQVVVIRAVAANGQPFTLRESGQQAKIGRTQRQPQFPFAFQPVRQREPFVLGTFTRYRDIAQIGKRRYRQG